MKFTSRRAEVTEKSTKEEDEKVSLTDFATKVTENNALWDEFINKVRGSKIITNDGVLLVFEEFRRKKTTKTHKRGKEFHDTACTQKQVMNSVKVARRSSAPLISLWESVRGNVRRCQSEIKNKLSDNLMYKFDDKFVKLDVSDVESRPRRQLCFYNEDIYVPEEECCLFTKLSNMFS